MRFDKLLSSIRGLIAGGALVVAFGSPLSFGVASALVVSGCGGAEEPRAKSAADVESSGADEGPADQTKKKARKQRKSKQRLAMAPLPPEDYCSGESEDCMPPSKWVSKLCSGVHPEVALHMFRGGSPWMRLYSRHRAPAFNGAGGPSMPDEKIEKGEELIALRRNSEAKESSAGEMSVGDTAGYDLLRWNGTCVTLHDGEFSTKPPRRRKHARVEWKALGDEIQTMLRTDGPVRRAFVMRRKECKGATIGRVSKKCVEQDQSLVSAIVDYVRAGGELPEPTERL